MMNKLIVPALLTVVLLGCNSDSSKKSAVTSPKKPTTPTTPTTPTVSSDKPLSSTFSYDWQGDETFKPLSDALGSVKTRHGEQLHDSIEHVVRRSIVITQDVKNSLFNAKYLDSPYFSIQELEQFVIRHENDLQNKSKHLVCYITLDKIIQQDATCSNGNEMDESANCNRNAGQPTLRLCTNPNDEFLDLKATIFEQVESLVMADDWSDKQTFTQGEINIASYNPFIVSDINKIGTVNVEFEYSNQNGHSYLVKFFDNENDLESLYNFYSVSKQGDNFKAATESHDGKAELSFSENEQSGKMSNTFLKVSDEKFSVQNLRISMD